MRQREKKEKKRKKEKRKKRKKSTRERDVTETSQDPIVDLRNHLDWQCRILGLSIVGLILNSW